MSVCLVALKYVLDQGVEIPPRRLSPGRDEDEEERYDDPGASDDEEGELKRGVIMMMIAGLFPVIIWLYLHFFFPESLMIDISPGNDQPASVIVPTTDK